MKEKNVKIELGIRTILFELNDECNIIENKTLTIKEICSWLLSCSMDKREIRFIYGETAAGKLSSLTNEKLLRQKSISGEGQSDLESSPRGRRRSYTSRWKKICETGMPRFEAGSKE